MTTSGKLIPALLSALILTACGGGETSSSSTTSSTPVGGDDPAPVDTNTAPVISGSPSGSVDEGSSYSFTPVASDADGDTLSFTIENQPYWASFDTATGRLSGTPDENAAGTYSNLQIQVSDGELNDTLPSFDIVVNNVDQGGGDPDPVLTETAPTLNEVLISGSDIVLHWSHEGLTPEGGYDIFVDGVDTGTQYRTSSMTATIRGLDLSSSHCFNIEARYTVSYTFYPSNQLCSVAQEPENQAPEISGSSVADVVAGTEYSFTPTASDPDGDSLTFEVSNLPSWATFNSQTGTISGTPQESDVGVYADVSLSVTDGELTASISPFSITVETAQVETGSLALSWAAPATRTDGSTLEIHEIDGYCIYLGETSDNLQMEIDLNNGLADNYTLTDLPVGTYFVAVTAYDIDGNYSGFSNTIEVNVSN